MDRGSAGRNGTLRNEIRAELEAVRPLDALEQRHLADAFAWLESGVELCRIEKPATPPKHLVAYFPVVDGESILLVDHRNAELWLPTGGHVEPGEHPRETVRRELREELGLRALEAIGPPLMLTCTTTVGRTAGHTDVSLWYLVRADRGRALAFDREEFREVRWFRLDEVPHPRSDPHLARFLRKLSWSAA